MTDFTTPDPSLAVGCDVCGFTVCAVEPLPEFSGTGYVMRHEATGARLLWVACADTNRSFSISFKTPPADDTGVFHILEHSVLCGSERFPVKEPFVNLLKTSMQTFLNALTFSDKTMYPVASTNIRDLENLMDVYLDAVLHPAIYKRPRIFEQEGWHLELAPDGTLAYNGVVFNEMKGATSDPDDVLFLNIDRALFPDTCYSFESGGDPRAIPTLTYEQFLDNHERHYNPANSYVTLYGDMDIRRELAFIGERLAQAPRRSDKAPNELTLQSPVEAGYARVEMATAPENAAVACAYVVGTAADRERVLATEVLLDVLASSNESPLKRRILDADLGDDFIATIADGELQPRAIFMLKGAKPGVADTFKSLLETACAEFVADGIDTDKIAASLAQLEFFLREQDSGSYPTGILVSIAAMSSWLYDDERPVDYLRFEDELAHMKAELDKGYFERLLSEIVLENGHWAEVELVPVEEGAALEEAAELRSLRETLDDEALARIQAEVEALRAEQEAPDAPADLANLPQLRISDIDTDAADAGELEVVEAPLPCLAHELDTRHIDYVNYYFNLSGVPVEELPYLPVLYSLLGKLPTSEHTASELDTIIQRNLGFLTFGCEAQADVDDLRNCFAHLVVSTGALSENVDQAALIPKEVWGKTLFDDTDRILAILTQRRIAAEQQFVNGGHSSASARLLSFWSAAGKINELLSGIDHYLFLKDLLASWGERKDELVAHLTTLSKAIFTAANATVSFTGPAEDRQRFWKVASTLDLRQGEPPSAHLRIEGLSAHNEAYVIPSNVSFVAAATAPSDGKRHAFGTWKVASHVLTYDYLWNEVRVKGGAYGTGFRHTQADVKQFWSYRDPNVDATLARFDATAAWLANWKASELEFDGYVVSSVASWDTPIKARRLAHRQDVLYLSKRPADWHQQIRAQLLASTPEAVRALADDLKDHERKRSTVVFGPREAIEASEVAFDTVVELMG